ncbi:MAG: sugar phosphate nucleotidyltransferase [Candidatus Humimicrobiaceae bacterium]
MRVEVVAFVLSGGEGQRLLPLTKDRAKPAIPFGGSYRVIDLVLSNLIHSGIRKIYVLTQYESRSLEKHILEGWSPIFGTGCYNFIRILPPKLGNESGWYLGTADAINQNKSYVWADKPNIVDIFSSDHIYLMDISLMNDFHLESSADITISAIPVKCSTAAKKYGVLVVDKNWKLIGFEEKPEIPTPMPGNSEYCLASMGNYAFNLKILIEELVIDNLKRTSSDRNLIKSDAEHYSSHDFGFDVIPAMLNRGRKIYVYNFNDNVIIGENKNEKSYWRDIGDLDEFYVANMDLLKSQPEINLLNKKWEIFTRVASVRPLKINGNSKVYKSIIANGCIINNASIEKSILSYNVMVEENTKIYGSFIMGNNYIGKNVSIKNSIIDTGIYIPDNTLIGINKEDDLRRNFYFSEEGITIIPRKYRF